MKSLKAKLHKEGGFTLVEMLIVVAIIAILIAISIPMINQALERSRHAVDQANIRDAIALATIEYLTDPTEDAFETTQEYEYMVNGNHQGKLVAVGTTSSGFNTVEAACTCGTPPPDNLKVKVDKDGIVTVNWKTSTSGKGNTISNSAY